MTLLRKGREQAFETVSLFWIPSGLIILMVSKFIRKDEMMTAIALDRRYSGSIDLT